MPCLRPSPRAAHVGDLSHVCNLIAGDHRKVGITFDEYGFFLGMTAEVNDEIGERAGF